MSDLEQGPKKSVVQKSINGLGGAVARFGRLVPSLAPDELIRAALRKKASNTGDEAPPQGLVKLTEAIDKDGNLTTSGRIAVKRELIQLYANRHAVRTHIASNPSCAREKIPRPIFVTGLPRSGLGLLHRLMAQDELSRPIYAWECRYPYPPITTLTYDSDPRIARFAREVKELYRTLPEYRAIRPIEHGDTADCSALMSLEFLSHDFFMFMNIPSYQAWLELENTDQIYKAHKAMLQYLQSSAFRGERWLLKSPSHMHGISSLLKVYPDAVIITVHRDPVVALASHASQVAMLRSMWSDSVDRAAVGRQIVEWWDDMATAYLEARKKFETREGTFIDIRYDDLVRDPFKSIEGIYRFCGLDFTFELHKRIQHHLNTHPRGRWGSHNSIPREYGMDPAADRALFEKYNARFKV